MGAFESRPVYNPDNVQLGVICTGFGADAVTSNQISKASGRDRVPSDAATGTVNSGNRDFDCTLPEIANQPLDELESTLNAVIAEPYAPFLTVPLEQNYFHAKTVMERAQLCSLRGHGSQAGGFSPNRIAAGKA